MPRDGAKRFAPSRGVSDTAKEWPDPRERSAAPEALEKADSPRSDAKSRKTARAKREPGPVEPARNAHPALPTQRLDRAARLEQARSLLAHAATQSVQKLNVPPKPPVEARILDDSTDPFSNSFEDADPFEPFEQCAPAAAPEPQPDSAYSRSTERPRKAPDAKNSKRPQRSLKGRALAYLSRREHSRAELSRKLRPYVQEADSLEGTLDSLERDGWLSNERFVESVVHRRAARMGGSRIINELKRHAVGEALIGETADKLAQTETARAYAVWERKYGVVPETPAERAKQARFLAARGFSASTIGKILKGGEEDWIDEPSDE
ncbi:recombination regulator RecX [Caballeronia sp. LZ062]|uniref:recombination regulator RecX n=2 Tax=unclassified Caballeronia TaxID=2646786 RepID=UPI002857605E|nr:MULTISPECIES: recombination regulator RecX [unclassified Caballeronia]MDR5853695.1 recombination regulator RecX [Caballeronia sp. LZ050]MDR5871772.1 recombination regulator RecX [Caballeronia sp. LZ062]